MDGPRVYENSPQLAVVQCLNLAPLRNWKNGIVEEWNNGFEEMGYCDIYKIPLDSEVNKRLLFF